MQQATLRRYKPKGDSFGTFGRFFVGTKDNEKIGYFSLELPWKDNLPNESCVPSGTYKAVWSPSPKHGFVYELQGVPGRSDVQIHSGNFKEHSLGCILLGKTIDTAEGKKGVFKSKEALAEMEKFFNYEPFELMVTWGM